MATKSKTTKSITRTAIPTLVPIASQEALQSVLRASTGIVTDTVTDYHKSLRLVRSVNAQDVASKRRVAVTNDDGTVTHELVRLGETIGIGTINLADYGLGAFTQYLNYDGTESAAADYAKRIMQNTALVKKLESMLGLKGARIHGITLNKSLFSVRGSDVNRFARITYETSPIGIESQQKETTRVNVNTGTQDSALSAVPRMTHLSRETYVQVQEVLGFTRTQAESDYDTAVSLMHERNKKSLLARELERLDAERAAAIAKYK